MIDNFITGMGKHQFGPTCLIYVNMKYFKTCYFVAFDFTALIIFYSDVSHIQIYLIND